MASIESVEVAGSRRKIKVPVRSPQERYVMSFRARDMRWDASIQPCHQAAGGTQSTFSHYFSKKSLLMKSVQSYIDRALSVFG